MKAHEIQLSVCRTLIRFDLEKPGDYRRAIAEHEKDCKRCKGFRAACGEVSRQLAQGKPANPGNPRR